MGVVTLKLPRQERQMTTDVESKQVAEGREAADRLQMRPEPAEGTRVVSKKLPR